MKPETDPIPKEDANLTESLQILSKDLVDYWEARLKLLQAQATEKAKRFGKAVVLALAAIIVAIAGYFVALAFLAVLLARQFDGHFLWPLLILTAVHLLLAGALAAGSLWKFKVPSEIPSRKPHPHPDSL